MTSIGIPAMMGGGPLASTGNVALTTASSFAGALAGQQQQDAARAVLATLPAPIVYSLRDRPGSPADSVDRLFRVLKDGAFTPPTGPLGRPNSIIGATAHAATLFDTPDQLWDAMRVAIADPAGAAASWRVATGTPRASGVAGPPPGAERAFPEVRTLEDAERLLLEIRAGGVEGGSTGSATAASAADWWEAALRFLLGARFPA